MPYGHMSSLTTFGQCIGAYLHNSYVYYMSNTLLLIFRDAVVTSGVNCFTSFLAGFAVFSVLGHMAKTQGTDIANVAREGN